MKPAFVLLSLLSIAFASCKEEGNPAGEKGLNSNVETPVTQDMIQVPGGTFMMGSNLVDDNAASPSHSVTLGSFSIDKYEITYENWTDVRSWAMTHGYTDLPTGRNGFMGTTNHPVTMVDWYDIVKWCNARSEKDGLIPVYHTDDSLAIVYRAGKIDLDTAEVKWTANGYRLPTEAEWEYATRGGSGSKDYAYSGSNILDSVAWYSTNSGNNTHPVAAKGANELGLYDMSGNVWEWCWDRFGRYKALAQTNPKGSSFGTSRVLRGGSFSYFGYFCRVAYRYNFPDFPYYNLGFRCVRHLD